jgi:hypothetical protein
VHGGRVDGGVRVVDHAEPRSWLSLLPVVVRFPVAVSDGFQCRFPVRLIWSFDPVLIQGSSASHRQGFFI